MKIGKYQLIYSDFDKETGESKVRILTDVGVFEGDAQCHPDERPSIYLGCEIAELRAMIKWRKELIKIGKAQKKELLTLYNTVAQSNKFEYDNFYTSKMRKAIYEKKTWIKERECEIEEFQKTIEALLGSYARYCTKLPKDKN